MSDDQQSKSESEKQELLPCPFCGGDSEITGATECGPQAFVVVCCNCMACSKVVFALKDSPEPKLIEAWNTRQALSSKGGDT